LSNIDTQTSPGIGMLPPAFSVMGGLIIDMVGVTGRRLTQQTAGSHLFKGWVPPSPNWLTIIADHLAGIDFPSILGNGLSAANFRITLYDGDSGSPNPVYVAQFGAGHFYYTRSTPQPPDFDFDGGQNLFFGFLDVFGNPVNCGFMGETTTYRLDNADATHDTFTGFPGVFGETDLYVINHVAAPDPYYLPAFAVTGWFRVPPAHLNDLYQALLSGVLQVGVYDISPGDQYFDFTLGLAEDVIDIPITPTEPPPTPPGEPGNLYLDLWVWRLLTQFSALDETVDFPPGYEKALRYALAAQLAIEYGRDSEVQEALARDAELAIEGLNASNDLAIEDPPEMPVQPEVTA
jgi:hypothetical protein